MWPIALLVAPPPLVEPTACYSHRQHHPTSVHLLRYSKNGAWMERVAQTLSQEDNGAAEEAHQEDGGTSSGALRRSSRGNGVPPPARPSAPTLSSAHPANLLYKEPKLTSDSYHPIPNRLSDRAAVQNDSYESELLELSYGNLTMQGQRITTHMPCGDLQDLSHWTFGRYFDPITHQVCPMDSRYESYLDEVALYYIALRPLRLLLL